MNANRIIPRLALAAMLLGGAGASSAGQLAVEPILLEMNAPSAAGVIKLRNDADVDVIAQTRVLRWTQVDGVEKLEPTTDVVSSPPEVSLAPKVDYVVRVVRVSKQPVRGEESYRVLVDQLPSSPRVSKSDSETAHPPVDSGIFPRSPSRRGRCFLVAEPQRRNPVLERRQRRRRAIAARFLAASRRLGNDDSHSATAWSAMSSDIRRCAGRRRVIPAILASAGP